MTSPFLTPVHQNNRIEFVTQSATPMDANKGVAVVTPQLFTSHKSFRQIEEVTPQEVRRETMGKETPTEKEWGAKLHSKCMGKRSTKQINFEMNSSAKQHSDAVISTFNALANLMRFANISKTFVYVVLFYRA